MSAQRKAYLIGGGIGSLAAAAFLVRDGNMPGSDITIFEANPVVGGSLDAARIASDSYSFRGGRMFTTDNYECTWSLFKDIDSLRRPGQSVFDETMAFNELHRSNAMVRLVDARHAKVPVTSMGFSSHDRLALLALFRASEADLDATCITDWLPPSFFKTAFWFMWATTFAFQPWHSAIEFKRYLHRFMMEFARIDTLAGVKRTVFNQYDSLVLPLQSWLRRKGVQFLEGTLVTDIVHREEDARLVVTGIESVGEAGHVSYRIGREDLVFLQNGSMTDSSSIGSMTQAPALLDKSTSHGWTLWERLAEGRPEFGNPAAFNNRVAESAWQSFTITSKDRRFFDAMQAFSGNEAGTGGLVTFIDSNWLMSIVLPHQPHFADQPGGLQVFWGYGLSSDRIGNFVARSMQDCSGTEILKELCGHLRLDRGQVESAVCIPCRMPYITSMFMPRVGTDRPRPVPSTSVNLALISQFVEIADDVVFTVEYSIRAAQIAVYQLLQIDRPIPAVTPHDKNVLVQIEAMVKAFA
ncbi:MAG: oleate hydratase [Rhizobacter sp.]|nr:oleate hydratase [Rhizobacter sp.]